MRVAQVQFLRCLQDLGYTGDTRELFKSLNQDQTGTLLFYHFAPEAAQRVAELMQWVRANAQSMGAVLASVVDPGARLSRQQLASVLKKRGFLDEEAIADAFELADKDGDGSIDASDARVLDKWDFPEWLTATADEEAAETVKDSLVERCGGHVLLAWRHLDKQANLRVSWHEFRQACRKLLPAEDCAKLPAVWRALDDDLSGWLSLQEYDSAIAADLSELCAWVQAEHGSFCSAFPKLQQSSDYRTTLSEFRHVFKASGLDSSLSELFAGADMDGHGSLGLAEMRFLDACRNACQAQQSKSTSAAAVSGEARKKMGTWAGGSLRSGIDPLAPRHSVGIVHSHDSSAVVNPRFRTTVF